jgi:acyl carrier protein
LDKTEITEDGLRQWTRNHLAARLGLAPEAIFLDRSLADYGLDSVDGVLLAGELEDVFGVEVDPAAFLQFDSFEEMIVGLARSLPGHGTA